MYSKRGTQLATSAMVVCLANSGWWPSMSSPSISFCSSVRFTRAAYRQLPNSTRKKPVRFFRYSR
ncbi:hypothetical protein D3C78_1977800 [compost metagenome]